MRLISLALAGLFASSALAQSSQWVWWEAEKPASTNFPPAQRGDPKEQEVLSEGQWIGLGGDYGEGKFLEYTVKVPAAGEYDFFVRKFWKHGPFRWRFDEQPWNEVGNNPTLLDAVEMRTHWVANWVPAGTVTLSAGEHKLRIEMTATSGAAYFDAFLLTQAPFSPRGKLKPDEKYPPAPEGWVNFEPGLDAFEKSPIDLRMLNEKTAGENGFIEVKGEDFVHGKTGDTVKFWAVNAGPAVIDMPQRYVDSLAKFLAKRGVNMVRLHGPVYIGSGPRAGQIDEKHLDNIFYFIAAMKREGIYSHLSIHFQHWLRIDQLEQFPGYTNETMPFAIHFFSPDFQKIYQNWWDAVLTRQNPHTGNALKDEPAVAGLELLNEDSFFFWTFTYERIPASQMQILEKLFAQWAKKRHGSLENAIAKWGGEVRKNDVVAEDRLELVGPWHLFNIRDLRGQDTARFLAEVQRAFFDNHRDYVKQLGFKGAVCASNWITANPEYLEPIDSWTNLGTDFMDHHGYFDRPSKKNVQSFAFQPGDQYADRSAIRMDPGSIGGAPAADFPFLDVIHNGQPSMVSEFAWNNPNRFRSEMPLFVSALSSLNGMDAMVLFALDSVPQWRGTETENYWPIQTPSDIGQSPAASILFRKGYVREADAVVRVNINVEDMFTLKGAPHRTAALGDFLRAVETPAEGQQASQRRIDSAAMAVGKVAVNYNERPSSFEREDLSRFVDAGEKVITSQHGETRWAYGRGLFLVTAPMAHGVAGFLKDGGSIQLPQAVIRSDMEFGSIMIVPLDDKPLAESGRMLLQVMSEQKNTGWETEGEGMKTIKSVGQQPIIYRALSGEVKLTRGDAGSLRVTALDWNGYPVKQLPAGESIRIEPSLPYYLVEKE